MTIVLNTEFDEFQHFRVILTKDHTKTDATASCFLISEMLKFVQKDGLNCKNNTHVRNTYLVLLTSADSPIRHQIFTP